MTTERWSTAHRSARRSAASCVAALKRTSRSQAAADAFTVIEHALGNADRPPEAGASDALEIVGYPVEIATTFTEGTNRDDLYDAARAAIGTLVAFGTPWKRVEHLLAALDEAWGHDLTATPSADAADHETPGTSTLYYRHHVAYEIARTHLAGLCTTAPLEQWSGYAEVLDRVDMLRAPAALVPALPLVSVTRPVMRAAASAAIQELSGHGPDPAALLAARDRLDAVWASEPPGVPA
ncbi:hypothetical protein [Isoptericola nanjingensis]|uniref:hypothetical protein n=1 Tax=Isoptericola nanjingensis TaxID=903413 RepID=UPI003D1D8CF1